MLSTDPSNCPGVSDNCSKRTKERVSRSSLIRSVSQIREGDGVSPRSYIFRDKLIQLRVGVAKTASVLEKGRRTVNPFTLNLGHRYAKLSSSLGFLRETKR